MKNILTLILLLSVPAALLSQLPAYSWKFYTPGNTGIMGDYSEALWIDHDGDPYIAAYVQDMKKAVSQSLSRVKISGSIIQMLNTR